MVGAAFTDLPPKTQEALSEFFECVDSEFTGNLSVDFKDGVPQVTKRLHTRRLGSKRDGKRLTGGT